MYPGLEKLWDNWSTGHPGTELPESLSVKQPMGLSDLRIMHPSGSESASEPAAVNVTGALVVTLCVPPTPARLYHSTEAVPTRQDRVQFMFQPMRSEDIGGKTRMFEPLAFTVHMMYPDQ